MPLWPTIDSDGRPHLDICMPTENPCKEIYQPRVRCSYLNTDLSSYCGSVSVSVGKGPHPRHLLGCGVDHDGERLVGEIRPCVAIFIDDRPLEVLTERSTVRFQAPLGQRRLAP